MQKKSVAQVGRLKKIIRGNGKRLRRQARHTFLYCHPSYILPPPNSLVTKTRLCYNLAMKEFDFYVVPTPIGNLSDMTLRAIEVLKSVDLIACEDSRVTQKLLNHFDIKTKCVSYHKYNEKERINQILDFLKSGKKWHWYLMPAHH